MRKGKSMNKQIEKYQIFEIVINETGPLPVIEDCAIFTKGEIQLRVSAFVNGEGRYAVRFMPQLEGIWKYKISIGMSEIYGEFECIPNWGNNHGPVRTRGYHFCYADGETYIPTGTTCYAWIHQTEELQRQTLATLAEAPFNKIRMCVFPKSMPYNKNDPDCYPFRKKEDGEWDISSPDPEFWDKLDRRIEGLMELGIEADLILFHPYDRWGFAELSQEQSLTYLRYCIARLSAYRNVWWSLANEYEVVYKKSINDWDEYGEMLLKMDVYGHLISVHNIILPFPKKRWMTHCSIQSKEISRIVFWKQEYQLPVIIDECGYEGDLPYDWGSLTAFEMVHRFWWTVCRDGFCTHGETFHREDEVLWWAKGGKLYGESAVRIAFLKEFLYSLPGDWSTTMPTGTNPNLDESDEEAVKQEQSFMEVLENAPKEAREAFITYVSPMKLEGENYYLEYLGRIRPVYKELSLREDRIYRIEIIDIWEMTRTLAAEGVRGEVRIGLPGKEGIAIFVMEMVDAK